MTSEAQHILYVALSRMVREHEELTTSRERMGHPPALTNECLHLARKALEAHEIELAGFRS